MAYEVAPRFGVKPDEAKRIVREVGQALAQWREISAATGLSNKETDRMASAFEHEDLRKAIA